jgi:hypothetical protein
MKAQLCPVCNGSGKYDNKECHGCYGKGWVTVPEYHIIYDALPIKKKKWPAPEPFEV